MKRLNHIDAMRAFSMFLIVYSHLVHYGLQQTISLFNRWTETFFRKWGDDSSLNFIRRSAYT